ncbi:MAG: bifunctional diaminohydroxyphosphoribosylaminopyrimidine deaminase/5-amino-6-(5-phosphoribosylamino)uracil reductase RibD [Deltaproteobacteria bacterium]|nr:bifunctional diaminohydroxyphosphoribosylaminopyrimidine deaminase/5-amino-6-(5-phosphoribosylamino)uracil reductase RibD [Deltaproteobacteria bacterium]
MRLALDEARRGLGRTSPNPAVGAVIVKNGRVVATGYHRRAGTDHAEVAALKQLDFNADGCTLYSTLEPCDHYGRTGPCTEAILRAGVRRVVVGAADPNPLVRGRGIKRLAKSGVEVIRGVLEGPCTDLNEAFNFAIVHQRPFVVLKAAMSLDGRIATRSGESQWITSPAARRAAHRLRDQLDGVVVGVETVLADDPLLTARVRGGRDPVRIVLDSRLRTPPSAALIKDASGGRTIIATTDRAPAARRRALARLGADVLPVKATRKGRVDLDALLAALSARGLSSVLVEGGARVLGAFLDERLVGRVVVFIAPILIGGEDAPPAFGGRGVASLAEALRLESLSVEPVGPDLMLTGRVRKG